MKITMLIMNTIFMNLSNPLSIGITLILQTIMISTISGIMMPTFWFSYTLILIYLGGMLILFIYMASLASNEKFKSPLNLMIITIPIMLSPLLMNDLPSMMKDSKMKELTNLMPMITVSSQTMTILLITYLLITLIAVVKMTKFWQGPLRTN